METCQLIKVIFDIRDGCFYYIVKGIGSRILVFDYFVDANAYINFMGYTYEYSELHTDVF